MKIAIYMRKSRLTDKGESIENQLSLCKQYALLHFENPCFDAYRDEGYSGSHVNRPAFQELIKNIKKGQYDVLICYRLDRISRNVLDFSSTLDLLTKHHVAFVSIKENFDTTTPMGRAMLHISSVFAQLERETIAERIRDNMLELSKTGRWLGGTTPLGYLSEKVAYDGSNNKKKYYTILKVDPFSAPIVKLIFNKYLEFGSLSQLESYLMNENIRTLNGKYYHPHALRNILSNPVYCSADESFYHYFYTLGAYMAHSKETFNGQHAPMVYNKNRQGKTAYQNNVSEWIVALGSHKPLVDSALWLKAQILLFKNRNKAIPHSQPSSYGLLSGLIYCEKCGAPMKVTNQSILKDGSMSYVYRCTTKLISHGKLCNIPNIKGHYLDQIMTEKLREILPSKQLLIEKLSKKRPILSLDQKQAEEEHIALEKNIETNEKAISKLVKLIMDTEDELVKNAYQKEIKLIQEKQALLKKALNKLQKYNIQPHEDLQDIRDIVKELESFEKRIDESSLTEKRLLLQSLIHTVLWNGKSISVYLIKAKEELDKGSRNLQKGCKITHEEW